MIILMVTNIMENGLKIKEMVKVTINGLVVMNILVNGKMIWNMVLE